MKSAIFGAIVGLSIHFAGTSFLEDPVRFLVITIGLVTANLLLQGKS
jgi:hypothetical protein